MVDREVLSELLGFGWSTAWQERFAALERPDLVPGRVTQVSRSFCQVLSVQGEITLQIPGRLRHRHRNPVELPAVGDWVVFTAGSKTGGGTVEQVLPRQGVITRQAPGRRGALLEQVIAANVDIVFIVVGLDRDYNLRRLERYLVLVDQSSARPVLILNKTDVCSDVADKCAEVSALWPDLPVHPLSARAESSADQLRPYLGFGTTAAFLGSSGAGKSTLINALIGFERQATGEVSSALGKGRHTTTHRELISLESGALLIDNPGMRELQLSGDSEDLGGTFDDIDDLSQGCRFNDCRHLSEPGCAVRAAVDSGTLANERYQGYLKLQKELDDRKLRQEIGSEAAEKERWRPVSKALKKKKRSGWVEDE